MARQTKEQLILVLKTAIDNAAKAEHKRQLEFLASGEFAFNAIETRMDSVLGLLIDYGFRGDEDGVMLSVMTVPTVKFSNFAQQYVDFSKLTVSRIKSLLSMPNSLLLADLGFETFSLAKVEYRKAQLQAEREAYERQRLNDKKAYSLRKKAYEMLLQADSLDGGDSAKRLAKATVCFS